MASARPTATPMITASSRAELFVDFVCFARTLTPARRWPASPAWPHRHLRSWRSAPRLRPPSRGHRPPPPRRWPLARANRQLLRRPPWPRREWAPPPRPPPAPAPPPTRRVARARALGG